MNITNLKHLVVPFNSLVKSRSVKNENINIQDISVLDFSKPAYIQYWLINNTYCEVYKGAIIGGHKPFSISACYTDICVIYNTSI